MGLFVQDRGQHTQTTYPDRLSTIPEHARNSTISFTLVRLLCKLVDCLAPPSQSNSPNKDGKSRAARSDLIQLESQFDAWHRNLPPSFHPDGKVSTVDPAGQQSSGLFTREIWFSNDVCSTTMMYYHMARLLFLFHQPPSQLLGESPRGTSFDLLLNVRPVDRNLQFHASEIISTVRSTSCDAVMLRAIQPLYFAGRCCTTTADKKGLVEMLMGIQDSLGVATMYRIEALLAEWGITRRDLGLKE